MALKKAIARMPDLAQYAISTATVHHEQLVLVLHQKTGVVAFRHQRVAGAQHRQFHFVFSHFILYMCFLASYVSIALSHFMATGSPGLLLYGSFRVVPASHPGVPSLAKRPQAERRVVPTLSFSPS